MIIIKIPYNIPYKIHYKISFDKTFFGLLDSLQITDAITAAQHYQLRRQIQGYLPVTSLASNYYCREWG